MDSVLSQPPLPRLTLPPERAAPARVQAIDLVRGLVMVLMALDHARDFWSPMPVRPEDVSQASAILFFTRWVTHFCAPTFVFLSGASVYLAAQRQPRRATSRFLLTRGLWLVVLEVVLISFVLQWTYHLILLQVIWVIGWSMVVLAGLIWLPRGALAGLALALLAGHNLLPAIEPVSPATAGMALLHNGPTVIPLGPGRPALLSAYTLVPWMGVMLAGYLVGPWFTLPPAQRRRRLRLAGGGLLALFGLLRLTNWYGDPQPWSAQARGAGYTVLSFLNVTKYPPSLLFLCLTLGVALLLLAQAEGRRGRLSEWLRTLGQVPFFYYLLHLLLISAGALIWTWRAFGQPVNLAFASVREWPAAYQPSLLRAYAVWALVVLALYWPCRWYRNYKQQHRYWWLSYL